MMNPDPQRQREIYVKQISELLNAVGMAPEELDAKLDRQLETEGGIDALSFDGLQKVIAWLEGKSNQAVNGNVK